MLPCQCCSLSLRVQLSRSCPLHPVPPLSAWHPPREGRQVCGCRCGCAGVCVRVWVCMRLLEEWGILESRGKEKGDRGAVGQGQHPGDHQELAEKQHP